MKLYMVHDIENDIVKVALTIDTVYDNYKDAVGSGALIPGDDNLKFYEVEPLTVKFYLDWKYEATPPATKIKAPKKKEK